MEQILIGCHDGRIFQLQLNSPIPLTQFTPSTGNTNTMVFGMVLYSNFLIVRSEFGKINIWHFDGNVWNQYKTIVIIKDDFEDNLSIIEIDVVDHYLVVGTPEGKLKLYDIDNDFSEYLTIKNCGKDIYRIRSNSFAIITLNNHGILTVIKKDSMKIVFQTKFDCLQEMDWPLAVSEEYICAMVSDHMYILNWNRQTLSYERKNNFGEINEGTKDLFIYKNQCYSANWSGKVIIWPLDTKPIQNIDKFEGRLGSLESIYVDDNYIYVGSHFGKLAIFNRSNLTHNKTIDFSKLNLAHASAPHNINVLKSSVFQLPEKIKDSVKDQIFAIAFSQDQVNKNLSVSGKYLLNGIKPLKSTGKLLEIDYPYWRVGFRALKKTYQWYIGYKSNKTYKTLDKLESKLIDDKDFMIKDSIHKDLFELLSKILSKQEAERQNFIKHCEINWFISSYNPNFQVNKDKINQDKMFQIMQALWEFMSSNKGYNIELEKTKN